MSALAVCAQIVAPTDLVTVVGPKCDQDHSGDVGAWWLGRQQQCSKGGRAQVVAVAWLLVTL